MKLKFLLIIAILLLAGCRSKKATLDKKQEKAIELVHNDIKKTETGRIETSILKLTNSDNFSIEPINGQNLSKVIYKGDTLSFLNAKIKYGKTSISEDASQIAETQKTEQDNSTSKKETESSEKHKAKQVKSSSWGVNIGIIVGIIVLLILVFLYFKTSNSPFGG
jgi:cobalamin biosynthesis Mg chelatase CobN